MSELHTSSPQRRIQGADRRKHSRNGRRTSDPHVNWRRIGWVFAAYALYLSVRALPSTVRHLFKQTTNA